MFKIQPLFLLLGYSVLILMAFNIRNVLDFMNISIMYSPLFFLVFIAKHNTELKDILMLEIEYIQNKVKVLHFLKDVFYSIMLICLSIVINLIVYILLYGWGFNFAVTVYDYVLYIFTSNFLFVSLMYFMSTLTFSKSISISILSVFWIVFMVDIESRSLINPFFYVGDPNSSLTYIFVQLGIGCVALFITAYLKTKSPYFLQAIRKI